jgi:hypothetical protein
MILLLNFYYKYLLQICSHRHIAISSGDLNILTLQCPTMSLAVLCCYFLWDLGHYNITNSPGDSCHINIATSLQDHFLLPPPLAEALGQMCWPDWFFLCPVRRALGSQPGKGSVLQYNLSEGRYHETPHLWFIHKSTHPSPYLIR